jgi:hypothetical protein
MTLIDFFDEVYRWAITATGIMGAACLVLFLPMAFFRRSRPAAATAFLFASYVFGFSCWVFAFIVSFKIAGVFWLVVGLLGLGVGVVPVALVAAAIGGYWSTVGDLLFAVGIVAAARIFGAFLMAHAEPNERALRPALLGLVTACAVLLGALALLRYQPEPPTGAGNLTAQALDHTQVAQGSPAAETGNTTPSRGPHESAVIENLKRIRPSEVGPGESPAYIDAWNALEVKLANAGFGTPDVQVANAKQILLGDLAGGRRYIAALGLTDQQMEAYRQAYLAEIGPQMLEQMAQADPSGDVAASLFNAALKRHALEVYNPFLTRQESREPVTAAESQPQAAEYWEQEWQTPKGDLYFGDNPPPGSEKIGAISAPSAEELLERRHEEARKHADRRRQEFEEQRLEAERISKQQEAVERAANSAAVQRMRRQEWLRRQQEWLRDCLATAQSQYTAQWAAECDANGEPSTCRLPVDNVNILDSRFSEAKAECQRAYLQGGH